MLIDSNILIYAINEDSTKSDVAKKFLTSLAENECFVAQQNIFETIRVLTHSQNPKPLTPKKSIDSVLLIAEGFQIIQPSAETTIIALELIQRYNVTGIHIFDTYLVATMLSSGVDTIATDNVKDFKQFSEIKVINPFT